MATLILICGLTGSGKTTAAKQLEAQTGAKRFCPAEWLVTLVGSKNDRSNLDRYRQAVEKLQKEQALDMLRRNIDVILEFGSWRQSERGHILERAHAVGAKVHLIFLDVDIETIKQRILNRNENGGPADIPIEAYEIDKWATWLEPPDTLEGDRYDHFEKRIIRP